LTSPDHRFDNVPDSTDQADININIT